MATVKTKSVEAKTHASAVAYDEYAVANLKNVS